METKGVFEGKTILITGASRGIGKAIALKLAKDGANIVIAAKTVEKHPKLEGTIYTAAAEVEAVGGKCLPIQCDIRDEVAVRATIDQTVSHFGGLDVVINNASAISLTGTEMTTMKSYDLMHSINTRGTFIVSKYAIPHLKKSANPHILMISPPLVMSPDWFGPHLAYTSAKYGMSECVLGLAHELKSSGIAVNALWPRTVIWTAAMNVLAAGHTGVDSRCRKPDIMADAAYGLLSMNSKTFTANFLIDEQFLRDNGVQDMDQYAVKPGAPALELDFFLPDGQCNTGDNVTMRSFWPKT